MQVFQLSHQGATPAPAADGHALWQAQSGVFFRLHPDHTTPGDSGYRVFNPRNLRLEHPPARIGLRAPVNTANVDTVTHAVTLFRALPNGDTRVTGHDIFRFDFTVNERGVLNCETVTRLTRGGGRKQLPVYVPSRDVVVFLQQLTDGLHHLSMVPAAGGPTTVVLPGQNFDLRHPRLLNADEILVAANPQGSFRRYRLSLSDRTLQPAIAPDDRQLQDQPSADEQVMLAAVGTTEGAVPALLSVPRSYQLAQIVALVAAHNPQVNQRRALLAAALLEAVDAGPIRAPSSDFAAHYARTEGAFLSPSGSFDDAMLQASFRHGFQAMVADYLDRDRSGRLQPAGKLRAEIARDALLAEINAQQALAATLFFEQQTASELRHVHLERVRLLNADAKRMRQLFADGHATRHDLLAATRVVAAAEADLQRVQEQLSYSAERLRAVCGLGSGAPLRLDDEPYALARFAAPPPAEWRTRALLNHPRLHSAAAQLSLAFAAPDALREHLPRDIAAGYINAHVRGDSWSQQSNVRSLRDIRDALRISHELAQEQLILIRITPTWRGRRRRVRRR